MRKTDVYPPQENFGVRRLHMSSGQTPVENSGSWVRAQWNDKEIELQRKGCGWKGLLWETSLVVQWLRRHASDAGGGDPGSIPGQGTRSHML